MTISSLNFDVTALREKILDLAMRGKLVPQDPDDEPASVLLEKIKAEKAQLVKEGKIKKSKKLPEITEDEKPFAIPDSWEWVRLGDVLKPEVKKKPTTNFYYIDIASVNNNTNIVEDENYIDISKDKVASRARQQLESGDILFSVVRPYLKNVAMVPDDRKYRVGSTGFYVLKPVFNLNSKYIFYLVLSNYVIKSMTRLMKGDNSPSIRKGDLQTFLIPLPPLEEQSRIADKIAQLFALLRKVESSTNDYAELQKMLHDKVLDLAMRGKLVEQDPNDEPASVLLEKIKAEKAQLVKDGKIKKSKPLPPITEDEKPFAIPDSWEWVRLGDVLLETIGGGTPAKSKPEYWNGDIPWISVKDVHEGSDIVSKTQDTITQAGLENSSTNLIPKNTLIAVMRMAVGRIAVNEMDACINQDLRALITSKFFVDNYLKYIYPTLKFSTSGITVKGIKINALLNTVIPLPPFEEQQKIVNRIKNVLEIL